jgi:hypothetical protein
METLYFLKRQTSWSIKGSDQIYLIMVKMSNLNMFLQPFPRVILGFRNKNGQVHLAVDTEGVVTWTLSKSNSHFYWGIILSLFCFWNPSIMNAPYTQCYWKRKQQGNRNVHLFKSMPSKATEYSNQNWRKDRLGPKTTKPWDIHLLNFKSELKRIHTLASQFPPWEVRFPLCSALCLQHPSGLRPGQW